MSVKIYHNPRCSKSRQTKQLLDDKGVDVEVIEYLQTPPDAKTLKKIIKALGIDAMQLVRKGEDEFKLAGLDRGNPSEDDIIDAMVKYPKLIERPIVINKDKAALGRPPENVLDVLD